MMVKKPICLWKLHGLVDYSTVRVVTEFPQKSSRMDGFRSFMFISIVVAFLCIKIINRLTDASDFVLCSKKSLPSEQPVTLGVNASARSSAVSFWHSISPSL
jgi:hypothetical protein